MVRLQSFSTGIKRLIGRVGKKRALALLCVVLLLAAIIVAALFLAISNRGIDAEQCADTAAKSQKKRQIARGRDDYAAAYEQLQTVGDACNSSKKILGLGGKAEDKVAQIEYYHEKATLGYRFGDLDEAKKDAAAGLELAENLPEGDKKKLSEGYDNIVQDFKWVQEGTY